MKKIIIIFLVANLLSVTFLYSGSGSIKSSPILMMDTTSAEGISVANNSVMQFGKVNFIQQNPGIIGTLNSLNANLSYIPWIFDTSYFIGNIGYKFNNIPPIGCSVAMFNSQDFEYVLNDGTISSDKLSISEFLLQIGSGLKIIQKSEIGLYSGIAIKYISSKIYTFSGNSLAIDAGLSGLYDLGKNKIIYGLSIQNIGLGAEYIQERSSLPFKIRIGAGYTFHLFSTHHSLFPMAEFVYDATSKINIGAEYSFKKMIFGRIGYSISSKQMVSSNIAAGVGVEYNNIKIDYAMKLLKESEKSLLHSFSIGYSL